MPGSLSASNRSQLAYKLEGTYPTNFGVLQAGNGTLLNMTSENLDYTIKNEQSKQIRSDRQIPDVVQVSASAQGGFQFEAQYKEYDPFLEGVMENPFVAYGTNGVSTTLTGTLTVTSATVLTASVASSGADIFTGLDKGQWFSIIPAVGESAAVKAYLKGRAFRLSVTVAPTSTVLTLDAATPVDNAVITAPLATGYKIASSRVYNGTTVKSYSLQVGHADVSQYRLYLGMIVSKMDVKLSVGSIVTGGFEFMGKSFTLGASSNMGGAPVASQTFTPANATRGVFDILEGGASVTATTYIKSADFSIDNKIRMQDAVGVFGTAGLAAGTLEVTGKLEVYFADAAMYNKIISGVASSLTIPLLDVDGNGYVYYFPNIKYTAAKVATGGLDQDNMLSMDFTATLDPLATSPTYQKTVAIYRVGT